MKVLAWAVYLAAIFAAAWEYGPELLVPFVFMAIIGFLTMKQEEQR